MSEQNRIVRGRSQEINPDSQGPAEAAEAAFQQSKERLDKIYRERKQSVQVIGFDFIPHTNRPKKIGFGKVVVKQRTITGSIYSTIFFPNVWKDEAMPLLKMDEATAAAEFARRKNLPNGGFARKAKKVTQLVSA